MQLFWEDLPWARSSVAGHICHPGVGLKNGSLDGQREPGLLAHWTCLSRLPCCLSTLISTWSSFACFCCCPFCGHLKWRHWGDIGTSGLIDSPSRGQFCCDELLPKELPVFVQTSSLGPGHCLTKTKAVQLLLFLQPCWWSWSSQTL